MQRTGLWNEIAEHVERSLHDREVMLEVERSQTRRLLAAMQVSPNGVVLVDRSERIAWCNRAAGAHFGFDCERDHLQHLTNLLRHPGFLDYLRGENPGNGVNFPRQDGTGSLKVYLFPFGDAGDRLMLSQDITDIERADQMRRDFVANVSHEIRTPLTVLSGFVETLQNLTLDDEERQRYLQIMAQQGARMQALIDDLLVLARLEGGPAPPLNAWVDVGDILDQAEREAHALSDGCHQLVFSCEGHAKIAGVATELISALTNLVGNAVRYTPAGGHIRVFWRSSVDGSGEFSVTDDGPGIPKSHLARLTERFYRMDRSRSRETGGTGLGLSIVKHVQSRHEGKLLIESVEGKGSTFRLTYPPWRLMRDVAKLESS
jgi:two-component system phosphate regulon sensor histidine kinase PhoR